MNPLTPVAVAIGRQSWMPKLLPVVVKVDTGLLKVSGGRVTLLRLGRLKLDFDADEYFCCDDSSDA